MSLCVDIDVINLYTCIIISQDTEMMTEHGKRKIEGLRGEASQER